MNPTSTALRVGCVVIGRNEGLRLVRCLDSLGRERPIVYVDSGSSDDSVKEAQRRGAHVVELSRDVPFTAARARNAGLEKLRAEAEIDAVQFIDGDCEVANGWLEHAQLELTNHTEVAAVCGRRRERYPDASVFNTVCDVEWDTPVGDALYFGGDVMIRTAVLDAVGGFRDDLIAGEEPELALRIRRAGWTIRRLDAEMTLHDAQMTRPSQWWKRAVRAGHAFAEGSDRFGEGPEHHWVKEARRVWFWGAVVPAVGLGGALPTLGLSLNLFWGYPLSTWRNYRSTRDRGRSPREAGLYALSCTLGRFPELQGMLGYHLRAAFGRRSTIIEYKKE